MYYTKIMTFIIAIQLHDSIIVAADTKKAIQQEDQSISLCSDPISKLHIWKNGIITGTGDYQLISRTIEIFEKVACSQLNYLPECLRVSRQFREREVSTPFSQIEQTKLLCSSYIEQGVQLYKVEQFGLSQPYYLVPFEVKDINVWLVDLSIEPILSDIQSLYNNLKNYANFSNPLDWVNYYASQIAPIFKKHSQKDLMMSPSFDLFCQTSKQSLYGHISNRPNSANSFSEIILNSILDLK